MLKNARTLLLIGMMTGMLTMVLFGRVDREDFPITPSYDKAIAPPEEGGGPKRRKPSPFSCTGKCKLPPQAKLRAMFSDGGAIKVRFKRSMFTADTAGAPGMFGAEFKALIDGKLRKRGWLNYKEDPLLYEVVRDFPDLFRGKHVVIPGSERPHYEYFLMSHLVNATRVTTLDYRMFQCEDPNIKVMLVEDFWKAPTTFDAAFSYSNFEHDGLGRYGDPIDPEGDLKAMAEIWTLLKPRGGLLVAVPVGPDCVNFNGNRIYGPIRLVKFLRGWELLKTYNVDKTVYGKCDQLLPVQGTFILRRHADPNFVDHAGMEKECPLLMKARKMSVRNRSV